MLALKCDVCGEPVDIINKDYEFKFYGPVKVRKTWRGQVATGMTTKMVHRKCDKSGDTQMADDPVHAYLNARAEFEKADQAVDRLRDIVFAAGNHLAKSRYKLSVSNGPPGYGYPMGVLGTDASINATTWPTAEELTKATSEWHSAYEKVKSAWNNLPAKTGLQPPPAIPTH